MPVAFRCAVYSHSLFCSGLLTCDVGGQVVVGGVECEVKTSAVAHAEDPDEASMSKLESMLLTAAVAVADLELVIERGKLMEDVTEVLIRHAAYVGGPSMSATLYGAFPSGTLLGRDVRGLHELADRLADGDRPMLDVLAELDEAALPPETPYDDYEGEADSQDGSESEAA